MGRQPADYSSLYAQRILIVEDNENVRRIVETIIRSWGVSELRLASDGEEALRILEGWIPTLVISDWNMKPMGGKVFLSHLRHVSNGRLGKVPVLILTGYSSGEVVQDALRAGANQIIVKPIVPSVLLSRVTWVLNDTRPFVREGDHYVLKAVTSASGKKPEQEPQSRSESQQAVAGEAAAETADSWYID